MPSRHATTVGKRTAALVATAQARRQLCHHCSPCSRRCDLSSSLSLSLSSMYYVPAPQHGKGGPERYSSKHHSCDSDVRRRRRRRRLFFSSSLLNSSASSWSSLCCRVINISDYAFATTPSSIATHYFATTASATSVTSVALPTFRNNNEHDDCPHRDVDDFVGGDSNPMTTTTTTTTTTTMYASSVASFRSNRVGRVVGGGHISGGGGDNGSYYCNCNVRPVGRHNPSLLQTACTTTTTAARPISSVADLLPDLTQHMKIWGASGYLLRALHADGAVPYWACMSLTNVIVRTSLVPLVLQSALTQTRFAAVAPEVQFLITCFQRDSKKLKDDGAPLGQRVDLIQKTFQTLRGIYKLRNVRPFDIFKSPLLQIPVFWYFSIDIRKIINGADPELAQQLTESGFLWVVDLTEPDPWYGLPILGGLLLYGNVELAMGKQTLSGETTSKSNLAIVLKDFFQSLAIFMPCFMSHNPAGVQIYLATSFLFTAVQGAALRNDSVRHIVGLPAMNAPPPEPVLVKEFLDMNKAGMDAAKAEKKKRRESGGDKVDDNDNDDDDFLGSGVLFPGFRSAFPGTARSSTIEGSVVRNVGLGGVKGANHGDGGVVFAPTEVGIQSLDGRMGGEEEGVGGGKGGLPKIARPNLTVGLGVLQPHMLRLPEKETMNAQRQQPKQDNQSSPFSQALAMAEPTEQREVMEHIPEEVMEAANRGEMPRPPLQFAPPEEGMQQTRKKLDTRKIAEKQKQNRRGGGGGGAASGKGGGSRKKQSQKKSQSRKR